ncbi:zinc knuckle CX2CX4HX4C containing protein, partial [Tanacetum coccineum]
MIRNSPIILKKWTMNMRLCKEELTRILVWVRIHDVLIQVFLEDGLSIIASQIESLTMGVPLIEGSGFTIEYEWKPPRCDLCKIFGQVHDHFPKKVSVPPTIVTPNVVNPTIEKTNDGFQTVGKKKMKGKSKSTNGGQVGGHSVKQNV